MDGLAEDGDAEKLQTASKKTQPKVSDGPSVPCAAGGDSPPAGTPKEETQSEKRSVEETRAARTKGKAA